MNVNSFLSQLLVEAAASRSSFKLPVRTRGATNESLSGLRVVGGVLLDEEDPVLLTGQTTAAQNGIWLASRGPWVRRADADHNDKVQPGMTVYVAEGGSAKSWWTITSPGPINLNVTSLTFETAFSNVSLTMTPAAPVGLTAFAGTSEEAARADHVHTLPENVLRASLGGATGDVAVNNQKITDLADPADPQDAATKAYADAAGGSAAMDEANLRAAAATLSTDIGFNGKKLRVVADPTDSQDAATKTSSELAAKSAAQDEVNLRAAASSLTQPLDVNGDKIQNLGAPGSNTDAANKEYVDTTAAAAAVAAATSELNLRTAAGQLTDDLGINGQNLSGVGNILAGTAQDISIVIDSASKIRANTTGIGFNGKTPVAPLATSLEAAYTGIDNAQPGEVYAKASDLNAFRTWVNTVFAHLADRGDIVI